MVPFLPFSLRNPEWCPNQWAPSPLSKSMRGRIRVDPACCFQRDWQNAHFSFSDQRICTGLKFFLGWDEIGWVRLTSFCRCCLVSIGPNLFWRKGFLYNKWRETDNTFSRVPSGTGHLGCAFCASSVFWCVWKQAMRFRRAVWIIKTPFLLNYLQNNTPPKIVFSKIFEFRMVRSPF